MIGVLAFVAGLVVGIGVGMTAHVGRARIRYRNVISERRRLSNLVYGIQRTCIQHEELDSQLAPIVLDDIRKSENDRKELL